ncbi:MAG: SMI1/KNR4 family protein [Pseudomonadota bacterium]
MDKFGELLARSQRFRGIDETLRSDGYPAPNRFTPVDLCEVESAEALLGLRFPEQLRRFYLEVGYGDFNLGTNGKRSFMGYDFFHPREAALKTNHESDDYMVWEGGTDDRLLRFASRIDYFFYTYNLERGDLVSIGNLCGDTVLSSDLCELLHNMESGAEFYYPHE